MKHDISKLVSSYGGVGSVIDVVDFNKDYSFIIENYDSWSFNGNESINDPRLLERLRGKGFGQLNDIKRIVTKTNVCARYFPRYFYYEGNNELKRFKEWKDEFNYKVENGEYADDKGFDFPLTLQKKKNSNRLGKRALKQVEYISICRHGHIQDIPWEEILTVDGNFDGDIIQRKPEQKFEKLKREGDFICGYNKGVKTHRIKLKQLEGKKIKCDGYSPQNDMTEGTIIVDDYAEICLLRSNAVYFANTIHSIYIPSESSGKCSISDEDFKRIKEDYIDEGYSNEKIKLKLISNGFSTSLIDKFLIDNKCRNIEENSLTEQEYRTGELIYLTNPENAYDNEKNGDSLKFDVLDTIDNFKSIGIKKIVRVRKLKQTSVQIAFTRTAPLDIDMFDFKAGDKEKNKVVPISTSNNPNIYTIKHIPAVESYGEGLLFILENEKIKTWYESNKNNLKLLIDSLKYNAEIDDRFKFKSQDLTPTILLVHTLSHILMMELGYSVGYNLSALRERLYIGKDGIGFMIYTIEGKGGSLGGIESLCDNQDELFNIFKRAISRSKNCSNDPICLNSDGQGLHKLNKGACQSCSLVPDLCCEMGNVFLDRNVLIGKEFGFFKNNV